ncbi:MAG: type IX secretion system sortase PorU [Bacteroidetes bacterium]|nr:type IX secretion system sortase PorU [Bacteroidota bacterium]
MNSRFSIKIFFFLFIVYLPVQISAQEDLKVLSSTQTSITIEYTPLISDSSVHTINSINYINFDLFLGSEAEIRLSGEPKIPFRLLNLGVPSEFGNTLEIISLESKNINGKPIPYPSFVSANEKVIKNYEESINYKNVESDEPVSFYDFGISRDLLIQTIKLSPIHYDASSGKIKIYSKIVFRLKYSNTARGNVKVQEDYSSGSLLNYSVASNWGIAKAAVKKTLSNSVLANGTWYRFEATKEGIYKISRAELNALGITASSVDPRTIKIYNNGGKNLPELPEQEAPTDLVENAIIVAGEEDGVFNDNDYILFYGRPTDFWEYDDLSRKIVRRHHPYSQKNYYWITAGGEPGKRIQTSASVTETNPYVQSSTKAFAATEVDKINIGKSGRTYWGDILNSNSKTLTYINSLNGIISGQPISYSFRFANSTKPNFTVSILENDQALTTRSVQGYGGETYVWGKATSFTVTHNRVIPDDRSVVKINASLSSTETNGYIDYMQIEYLKELKAFEDKLLFFTDPSNTSIEARLFNFSNSNISVFNISDYSNVSLIEPIKKSGGEVTLRLKADTLISYKYFALTNSQYFSISNIEQIKNSNIKGINPGADYIIITAKKFTDQANRLKNYRENEAPVKRKVAVVYVDEIMNEFSGGLLDPSAIRNFLRYAYNNWQTKPFYAFLFGDGTYDNYNLEGSGTNYVPTYQSVESLSEIYSYPTDDYYIRIIGNDQKADMAIGRGNFVSTSDADNYIDKIIAYENNSNKGLWLNTITLVADDGLTSDGNDGATHTNQAEFLAQKSVPDYFNKNKIYLSKYPTVITGLGRRKPSVNQAIIDAVNNGTLLLNYTGHGNPDTWAHEYIFERSSSLPQFNNDKYYFLTAATCDFGRYDDPSSISSTEEMVLMKNRGAIGVFSSARLVYSSDNAAINEKLYTYLMDETLNPTLGQALYFVKQTRTNENDEKFHLFCDPAIRLNKPTIPVSIDSVNGVSSGTTINVKALSEVSIKGAVKTAAGEIDNSFTGEGIITVFDSEKNRYLEDIRTTIKEQGGILFRGRVSIENGMFQTDFRVPKDISYENKNGKIVAYISNDTQEGIGFTNNIIVGGTDSSVVDDGKGPDISIFFDDLSFANAYLVNPDFNLLVQLKDETGLNTTGTGVGHKLEGIIDDEEDNPIDFSNYFVGDLNAGGKTGVVDYRFTDFKTGEHKIKIKAWDVFNNSSSLETFFTVVNSNEIAVKDVVNYPNPFSGNTSFTFQHNLNGAVDVKIKVYTIAGRVIKELELNGLLERFVKIPWDGRDQDGSQLANGTYLYKLIVKSTDGDYQKSILGKLAVIH